MMDENEIVNLLLEELTTLIAIIVAILFMKMMLVIIATGNIVVGVYQKILLCILLVE